MASQMASTEDMLRIRHHRSFVPEAVFQDPVLHPANRQQVVESFEEAVADAVFRHAMHARMMAHRNFGHGKSVHEGEGGKEPVHAGKELQPVDDFPAEHLE